MPAFPTHAALSKSALNTALLCALALVLAGCDGGGKGAEGTEPQKAPAAPRPGGPGAAPEGALPPGAIPIGDDLYMVPAGEDASGCPQYSGFSRTGAVAAVIHYRARGGGFTVDRAEADCD